MIRETFDIPTTYKRLIPFISILEKNKNVIHVYLDYFSFLFCTKVVDPSSSACIETGYKD